MRSRCRITHERAVQLVGAGLGEDFNAPVAKLVVLRREGVLVDADFADGRLWRELSAREAVDIDLSAIRDRPPHPPRQ